MALALLLMPSTAFAQQRVQQQHPCGSLQNAYGPFDYRIYEDQVEIQRVDEHHFTPLVEALIKPMFQYFAGDFDYTLRASPNHHRALVSMSRYSLRVKNVQPPGAGRTVECYFDRAMRFAPDDMVVRMLHADYLLKLGGRTDEAVRRLDHVAGIAAENAFTHYNVGLLYFEAKAYDKALKHAHNAMGLGLTLPGLKTKLESAGRWTAPVTTSALASEAPASAPATR